MKRRRSSSSITLVLIGAASLSGCGDSDVGDPTMRRDLYASRADCVQDWGDDAAKCEPTRSSSTRTGSSHYWGPAYRHGSYGSSRSIQSEGSTTSETRPGSRAVGTAHVSRSGFGSSSSSRSSSSSSSGGSRASSSGS